MGNNTEKDCWSCRLVTGLGILAIGAYIFKQAKGRSAIEAGTMKLLAAGSFGLGLAQLLKIQIFNTDKIKK